MSSTNRGTPREKDDRYETPAWCVHRLLERWHPAPGVYAEPAMGNGNIIKAVNEFFGQEIKWVGFDVNEGPHIPWVNRYQGDFLEEAWRGYHTSRAPSLDTTTVITNPPYSKAEAFVRACRQIYPNADLAFLLRLGFLASDDRLALYADLGAPDVYVLPNRPSFTGGGTDSADYGWFVWPRQVRRTEGKLVVLAGTPKEIRCRRQPSGILG